MVAHGKQEYERTLFEFYSVLLYMYVKHDSNIATEYEHKHILRTKKQTTASQEPDNNYVILTHNFYSPGTGSKATMNSL